MYTGSRFGIGKRAHTVGAQSFEKRKLDYAFVHATRNVQTEVKLVVRRVY